MLGGGECSGKKNSDRSEKASTALNETEFRQEVTFERSEDVKEVGVIQKVCGRGAHGQRGGQCSQYRLTKVGRECVVLRGGGPQAWDFTPCRREYTAGLEQRYRMRWLMF